MAPLTNVNHDSNHRTPHTTNPRTAATSAHWQLSHQSTQGGHGSNDRRHDILGASGEKHLGQARGYGEGRQLLPNGSQALLDDGSGRLHNTRAPV